MIIDSLVRDQVARYLAEMLSLEELYEWVAPRAWEADEPSIEHDIQLLISEVEDGSLTEEELRAELYELVPMAWSDPGRQRVVTLSSSVNTTQPIQLRVGAGHLTAAVRIG